MSDNFDKDMASKGFKFKAIPSDKDQEPLYFVTRQEFEEVTRDLPIRFTLHQLNSNGQVTSSLREYPLVIL